MTVTRIKRKFFSDLQKVYTSLIPLSLDRTVVLQARHRQARASLRGLLLTRLCFSTWTPRKKLAVYSCLR